MANPQHVTLTANVVATVIFDVDADLVEILNIDGSAEVWATIDTSTPAVGGNGSWLLPAAVGSIELRPPGTGTAPTTIKLISAGTPRVSVGVLR